MLAEPRPGTPSYLQGFAPAIEFADRARVYRTRLKTCVPVDCYGNVLLTDEWNPAEPGAHQRKYYASGVGNIRIGSAGKDAERETLVLTKLRRLSPPAMAFVRREALKLCRRDRGVNGLALAVPLEPVGIGLRFINEAQPIAVLPFLAIDALQDGIARPGEEIVADGRGLQLLDQRGDGLLDFVDLVRSKRRRGHDVTEIVEDVGSEG